MICVDFLIEIMVSITPVATGRYGGVHTPHYFRKRCIFIKVLVILSRKTLKNNGPD